MDIEDKIKILKEYTYEIIKEDELRELFEIKKHPLAYDGFEPSGLAHLPFGVYRPLIIKSLLKTGIKFKLLLADTFAWINMKFGGDIEKIRKVGEYFIEVWKAAGVDFNKVKIVWHKDFISDEEYWKKVILISQNHTLKRTLRALTIAGRVESLDNNTSFIFYPSMQAADIFHLNVDICQLGLDQRKVNMLAREVAEKIGWKKPIAVHHSLIMGLQGPIKPQKMDEDKRKDIMITSKMSKSKPDSAIFVHDSFEEIRRKLRKAYCPEREANDNPILQYFKEIVFRVNDRIIIERPIKYGGNLEILSYEELEKKYIKGEIHPLDLKETLAKYLDILISPIRKHFEKDNKARAIYEEIIKYKVTR